jgi:hypothetical protein
MEHEDLLPAYSLKAIVQVVCCEWCWKATEVRRWSLSETAQLAKAVVLEGGHTLTRTRQAQIVAHEGYDLA